MALPKAPDFSGFSEEDLFDEREDIHFLTEKSPYIHQQQITIPEGHEVGTRAIHVYREIERRLVRMTASRLSCCGTMCVVFHDAHAHTFFLFFLLSPSSFSLCF